MVIIVLTSAIAFTFLILIVILFQVALAVGVPWGEYAMGGKFPGKYPVAMRFSCIFQIAILAFMGIIVLSKAGLLWPQWSVFAETAIWFIVGYLVLGTILNLITRSVWEHRLKEVIPLVNP
ncbi:hypothetical protein [Paenibacillus amylolyticus]|uniref:hypothetical protein n=1 Tax=Paenibacillus amylolyticus TaxID=1451 RepID=UPI00249CC246|nr:hypothetical protein [Paenibacillus amylolyticus]WFA82631.1 hypothetical protein OGI70_16330 [Paenibacillus amylolyticus]